MRNNMVKVEVNCLVKTPQNYGALFNRLASIVARELKPGRLEISVALVGLGEMRRLNRKYRGKDKPTDVLSFEGVNEIVICFNQAKQQAAENKWSVKQEIGFLFVHGLLHLLGFDHQTRAGEREMFGWSGRILKKAGNK